MRIRSLGLPYDVAYFNTSCTAEHKFIISLAHNWHNNFGGYVRSRGKSDVWKHYGPGKTF